MKVADIPIQRMTDKAVKNNEIKTKARLGKIIRDKIIRRNTGFELDYMLFKKYFGHSDKALDATVDYYTLSTEQFKKKYGFVVYYDEMAFYDNNASKVSQIKGDKLKLIVDSNKNAEIRKR